MHTQQNAHVVAYKQFPMAQNIELLEQKFAAGEINEAEFEGAMFAIEIECNKLETCEIAYCDQRQHDYAMADLMHQRSAILSQLL